MSNYISHAQREFRAAGWLKEDGTYCDEMQEMICNHVLKLLDVFADEGHSGTSAPYALNVFDTLARFNPIAPLTGEDWEWICHTDERTNGVSVYQNTRCSSVFKQSDRFDGKPYWIDGIIWYRNEIDENGEEFKSYFTNSKSFITIEFPWTKPEKSEIREWVDD